MKLLVGGLDGGKRQLACRALAEFDGSRDSRQAKEAEEEQRQAAIDAMMKLGERAFRFYFFWRGPGVFLCNPGWLL